MQLFLQLIGASNPKRIIVEEGRRVYQTSLANNPLKHQMQLFDFREARAKQQIVKVQVGL
jgi:hypothetical protein